MDTGEQIIRDVEFLIASGVRVDDIGTIDDIRLFADRMDAMPVPTVSSTGGYFVLAWSVGEFDLVMEFRSPGVVRAIRCTGNCIIDDEVPADRVDLLLSFVEELGT